MAMEQSSSVSDAGVERMCAITISREYGSGGGEIAARLASRLGWQLVDHQIVAEVARTLGETEEEAAQQDERSASFAIRLLESLQWVGPWSGAQPGLGEEESQR